MTPQEVEQKFEKFGPVREARIVRNPVNGESRGFGFVAMKYEEDVDAVGVPPSCLLGHGLMSRFGKITVNVARVLCHQTHRLCIVHPSACAQHPALPSCAGLPDNWLCRALVQCGRMSRQHHDPRHDMASPDHCILSGGLQAIRTLDGAEWQGRRLGVERARNVK